MPLRALLADVDPAWYARDDGQAFDPQLVALARRSALGQRLLVRTLPATLTSTLLAPRPGAAAHVAMAKRWPRERLSALVRDIGILAFAPAIRGEVRREPVRWLRKVLGNGYLLALDRTVWDGQADRTVLARLSADWQALSADPAFLVDRAPLDALLDLQGRSELCAWAGARNPALDEWTRLVHGEAPPRPAHLPDKALLRVLTHHENRD
ncbi:MAG: hypothetical protein KA124_14695 [Luteimonas sp.]|nr:hypothetical protein [Luteimonas sp.]